MAEKMLLDADRVIRKFEQWNGEDADRASSAASTRSDIGEFVESTGYHKKALSDGRKLLKMFNDDPDKFEDYMRTFKPLLADIETHVAGQSTADMFADPVASDDEAPAPEMIDALEDPVTPLDDADLAGEAAEFDAAADEVFQEAG